MIRRSRGLILRAAAAAVIGVVSCGKGPTSPSQGSSAPNAIIGLELVAPHEISPGQSVQLTLNAVRSTGFMDNVTTKAQWTVLQSFPTNSVLAVTGTGLATGEECGRGVVSVLFSGFEAHATVLVLPKGTFHLLGGVSDTAVGPALPNATVMVTSGVGAGLTAHTDANGQYELFGVSGLVEMRASKEGYLDQTVQAKVARDDSRVDFTLSIAGPVGNFAGVYELTITARACSGDVPDDAKRRVYTAHIEQTGADLRVSLSGADFLPASSTFTGAVMATGEVRFLIRPSSSYDDLDGPDLQERLSDGTVLLTYGQIRATNTPQGISGTAIDHEGGGEGILHLRSEWSLLSNPIGACYIDRFDMMRR